MYVICYTYGNGLNDWEIVDGEDAMQERVCELIELYNLEDDDIIVFDYNDMIK